MTKVFDLVVIGAGPGGYVAAIRAAQLGFETAIVEKEVMQGKSKLGGTCLNWGCIPSKALLDSSEHFHLAKKTFKTHGIDLEGVKLNFKQMMSRKDTVVDNTTQGIEFLMTKNKITVFRGTASFESETSLSVSSKDGLESVSFKKAIIATGSEVTPLPGIDCDGKGIISSNEALYLTKQPKSMIVVGGGVIGVELGSVYARLGTKVTVVEFCPSLLPTMDKDLGPALQRSMKKLDVDFHLKSRVQKATYSKDKKTVKLDVLGSDDKPFKLEAEKVLVAIGRRPYTDQLGLDKVGIKTNEKGQIPVNASFQSVAPNIYAIGDVIEGPMLAHKASEEGVVCVEMMAGQKPHLDYNTIPGVVYTWPEVASVGQNEQDLKEKGIAYKVGKFPFKASGRARAAEESEGFVKVLASKENDELLGLHIIGPRAADKILLGVKSLVYRASAEDIASLVAPHPTYSEAIKEAALAVDDRAVHI